MLAVNTGELIVIVPEGPKLTCRLVPPRLYVTTAEGVPVKVIVEVDPLHTGEIAVTVAVNDETVIIILSAVVQLLRAT